MFIAAMWTLIIPIAASAAPGPSRHSPLMTLPTLAEPLGTGAISRTRMREAGFKAFERIGDLWKLEAPERHALLGVDAAAYAALREDPTRLGREQLARMSLTVGIFRHINELLPGGQADDWIKQANRAFDGLAAWDVMSSPNTAGLRRVRDYLVSIAGK